MPYDEEAPKRSYNREMILGFVVYGVLVAISSFVVDANPDAGWRYAIAPLPMIPAVFMVMAYVRYFRSADELQQRIGLESLAFAFGGTFIVTFTYGFLDIAGLHRISWIWVWAVMATLWIIGGFLARKRWL
ncbi:MAG: hypothetical protein OXS47_09960 [Chloroflexota bacterium]|nr:hypothetical protein [Chloroflexota bacterium]